MFIYIKYTVCMKLKFPLILIGLVLSLNAFSQTFSSMIYETWESGTWKNAVRLTNTFDEKGNIILVTNEIWNTTAGSWEKNAQTSYTLNANSTVASTTTQIWNKTGNKWEDAQKTLYSWNSSGTNLLTMKTSIFIMSVWMDNSLITNTYNGSNQVTQTVEQTWDIPTQKWKNAYQNNYTFNGDGTENQMVQQVWSLPLSAWVNESRSTNTYNSSKKVISELVEDYKSDVWVNDMLTKLTYNTDNTVKEALSQVWDLDTKAWMDDAKEFYTYQNGNMTQVLIQEWSGTLWKNAMRITYTFGGTSIFQPVLPDNDLLVVYPNPSAGEISISGKDAFDADITIFNQEGKLVKTISKGESLKGINLGSLRNGVYLLKAGKQGSEQATRFIICKVQ